MGYKFKRITYPIRKKNFKDMGEAYQDDGLMSQWIKDKDTSYGYENWLKSKGHTIGAITNQAASKIALTKLRKYLDASEPELVYFLVNTWNAQGKAITYKELREALLAGDIDQAYLQQWNEDYSKFVTEHLQPGWIDAMNAANADMAAKYPEWNFDPYADGVRSWTEKKAAEFVTNSSATQIMGLRAVVQRAAVLEDMTVDQLSRAIRPMVGLTYQQGIANLNYYTNLIKNGTSEKKALDLSIRYSARQHRYRAYNIARTELAFAYNQGSYEGTKQAQAAGYMGETVKVWCTADDERTCFPKDTEVLTPSGPRYIQDIKPGELVLTPDGAMKVAKTIAYEYAGDMTVVAAGDMSVMATKNHPFKTENGWKEAGDLRPNDTVYFAGDKSGQVDAILNFSFSNADNTPSARCEFFVAGGILGRSLSMPVIPISLDNETEIGEAEVDAVSANLNFRLESNPKSREGLRDGNLQGRSSSRGPVTMERAVTPRANCARDNSEWLPASFALNEDGRTPAFFGAEMPVNIGLGSEDLTAPFTRDILCGSEAASDRADGVSVSNGSADLERVTTYGTDFRNHNRFFAGKIALVRAEPSSFVARVEHLTAVGTWDVGADLCGIMGTSDGAEGTDALFNSLRTGELLSAVFALISKHGNHLADILAPGRQVCNTTVYNLEVCTNHVYYANGFLVHNCHICQGLEGKTIAMDDDFDFKTKLATPANPTIRRVPPAHPGCRCTVMYKEISPPIYQPTENPDHLPDAASEKDDGPAAAIPEGYELPDGLTYQGPASLGGTGKSYLYKDATGQEWIFKPGQNKDGSAAIYRAYVQEAGYKVQYIIDPDTAVPISRFTDSSGVFGAIQKKITGANISDELYKLYEGMDLPAELKSQIQREHVTDWLMANFDGHSKQFITNSAGQLVGLDKDQAFRYLQKDGAKKMSYTFHPNAIYGENEPIYNSLYRMFAKGDIDLDPNDVLPYIKRVESISNKAYREIFREYAESLNGQGKAAEALLDDIVERKDSLRETYRAFFEELLEERTGKKIAFKFADEGAEAAKQILTAQTMTKEAAMKMTTAELKKIAKDKGIAWFSDMTKEQLATCISDPTQISAVHEQVKAKVAERAARRAARAATPTTTTTRGKYTITNGVYEAEEIFDDFSAIPQDRKLGIAVASDSSKVEGLNLSARRVKVNGKDYIEISGKLTETATEELDSLMRSERRKRIVYGKGPLTDGKAALDDSNEITWARGIQISQDDLTVELITSKSERALMGTFRLRVLDTGDAIADAAKAKTALQNSHFSFVLDTPTNMDEDMMKKARLLFQQNPQASIAYGKMKEKIGGIEALMYADGVDPDDINRFVKKEVYPGYFTYVNEGAHKAYQKAGLEYIWSGVGRQESVVAMVKNGGQMSSMSRIKTGFMGDGASVRSDIQTGGADNVFTRVATKLAKKKGITYSDSYAGGSFQIIIKPSVADRTDWYAYHSDQFGTTEEAEMASRPSALNFFKQENKTYRAGNEIMFRHGIDIQDWLGIDCRTQTDKDRLIAALKSEGITQINGVNVERFIRVNNIVGLPWK